MITVVLDEMIYTHKVINFSGGEVGVKFDEVDDLIHNMSNDFFIKADLKSASDLIELIMVTDAIRRLRGHQSPDITLEMPYVPYARQDRVCAPGEAFGIKVLCDIINAQNYKSVHIWDPHSDVTTALLNNVTVMEQYMLFDLYYNPNFQEDTPLPGADNTVLVSPDAGANKKTFKFAQELGIDKVVRADKIRDVSNGKILETIVYSGHIGDKNFLIIDDICDGGRTFIELAKVLRPRTSGKIYLYVTHGIFSQGLEPFRGLIDGIYCPNIMNDKIDKNDELLISYISDNFGV